MMNRITAACVLVVCSQTVYAQDYPLVDIFTSQSGDYHTYRIPAVITTREGTLLAFCEGRKASRSDAGDIDMLVSRSTDNGKTWSSPAVVWDDGTNTCGNPAPVVDQTTGTVWLPMTWNLGSDHEREIAAGTSEYPRRVYLSKSTDDGKTWAAPIEISQTTRKSHWRWYATGPGNGIQLTHGKYKDRLVIPCNHSDHSDSKKHHFRSHIIYSDDHGKTWEIGGVHEPKTNESAIVELSDGRLMQLMRSYHGKGLRAVATSDDGGESWGEPILHEDLQTPVCQASAIRLALPKVDGTSDQGIILFSSPKGSKRSKMTVWASKDDGKSWPISKLIYGGDSAYSNLVGLSDGKIGLVFERDSYAKISITTIEMTDLQ